MSACTEILVQRGIRLDTDVLGEGGFGTVWKGENTRTGEDVAIKIVDDDRAYYHERNILKMVSTHGNHPNVLRFFDDLSPFPCVVTEYLPGKTLFELMCPDDRADLLSHSRIVNIVTQLTNAVSWVHAKHIIHRDIKLENVMVDENDTVTLIDFGLASCLRKGESKITHSAVGSQNYVAPEVLQRKCTNNPFACDMFSLGICIYALFHGSFPWLTADITCDAYFAFLRHFEKPKDSCAICVLYDVYRFGRESRVAENAPAVGRLLEGLLHPCDQKRITITQLMCYLCDIM